MLNEVIITNSAYLICISSLLYFILYSNMIVYVIYATVPHLIIQSVALCLWQARYDHFHCLI